MILNVANLNKTYVGKQILKGVTFHLEDKEKAAIVGINGSGKTTLIRCILGVEEPDDSETVIAFSKDKKIGYLAQQHADIETGVDDFDTLSGGQKTRKRLEEILQDKPDLLILDEPTNHLDIESIQWLEKVLKRYDGAVLLVSHDRYFLDHVVTKIIDLDNGKARMYKGNYSEYAVKKKQIRDSELKAYLNQQQEIQHQQAVIDKLKQFNREKSIKRAESREKALAKVELLDKPVELDNEMRLALTPSVQSGNDVLSVKDLSKAFDAKTLFSNISFEIKRGEHVAVIGANGTGKTTLLKILNQQVDADTGSFKLGTNVEIGYYDQEHAVLHMDKTIFDEIQDEYPYLNNTKVRNVLAAFLFRGDDVYKRIGDLSGGEQGRVSLAKLMLSNANFLILDEPTNHLDIQGREVLEDAINNYEGTVLYVSHDRYFINKTSSRILELFENRFDNYIGNYDYYLEKKEDVRKYGSAGADNSGSKNAAQVQTVTVQESEQKTDWLQQKELKKNLQRLERTLKTTEDEIQKLEARNQVLDDEYQNPDIAADVGKLMELHKEHEKNDARLEELYEIWEITSEELSEIKE
ncbi:MAG: ABC-F family ATP-binding cassette domain-containing protein [Oribacterium sp.]|nr:ABC-F family ATP-binding cassette domain-containing protein [Oribacterium sp.]MBO6309147.1 ABC-F family ATP-binding cassette domain-containing protein [Oribacterium sp.]MBP3804227.1 ABC-F family ATP-binding cassette domain-containing protein [Oribacterium sp.]